MNKGLILSDYIDYETNNFLMVFIDAVTETLVSYIFSSPNMQYSSFNIVNVAAFEDYYNIVYTDIFT